MASAVSWIGSTDSAAKGRTSVAVVLSCVVASIGFEDFFFSCCFRFFFLRLLALASVR